MLLSFQSRLLAGHVGHSAADPVLSGYGLSVLAVPTLLLSHHPGFRPEQGPPGRLNTGAEELDILMEGLARAGFLERCRALFTGYLTGRDQGRRILSWREQNRGLLPWICDPVCGDWETGIYVPEDLPRFYLDEAVPRADMLMPNSYELLALSGDVPPHAVAPPALDIAAWLRAARAMSERMAPGGPGLVLVSGIRNLPEFPDSHACLLTGRVPEGGSAAFLVLSEHLPATFNGAGDLLAAFFLGEMRKSEEQNAVEKSDSRPFLALSTPLPDLAGCLARATSLCTALLARSLEQSQQDAAIQAMQTGRHDPDMRFLPGLLQNPPAAARLVPLGLPAL